MNTVSVAALRARPAEAAASNSEAVQRSLNLTGQPDGWPVSFPPLLTKKINPLLYSHGIYCPHDYLD